MPRFPRALFVWARPATLCSFAAVSGLLRFFPRVGFAEVEAPSLCMESSSVVSRCETGYFPMVLERASGGAKLRVGREKEQPLSMVTHARGRHMIRNPDQTCCSLNKVFGPTQNNCVCNTIESYLSEPGGTVIVGAKVRFFILN